MVHIGIDTHKHSWHITAVVEGDTVLAATLSKLRYDSFKKILAQFEGNHVRIVYEAGLGASIFMTGLLLMALNDCDTSILDPDRKRSAEFESFLQGNILPLPLKTINPH